ncbi:MAG: pyrimidine utilization protein D [Pseudomonadota bacterium]
MYYEEHGSPDAPPLILSPGMGGSATYWLPNLGALAENYRVLLYDHRGTGRSDRKLADPVSVEQMTRDVVGLMDDLGIARAHFLGHALGGLIGLELSLEYPQRLDKLIVVNGWARVDPHFARCFDVRLDLLRHSGPAAYLRAQPIFLYPAEWISAHDADLKSESVLQLAHFPPVENLERRIAAARSYVGLHDHLLGPILLIAAADDMLVPAHCTLELEQAISAEPVQVANMNWGGHACNVTDPDTFNRIVLDFLRS